MNYNPTVPKKYLYLVSGIMWFAVGLMLMNFARTWIAVYAGEHRWIFVMAGIVLGLAIHHFGFLRVVDKNLSRIDPMADRPGLFSFMSVKSYLLVIIMMTMGIMLRRSALPRQYLAIIYTGIGLALALSSIRYFRYFFKQH